jgi:hypothetical protein
MTAECNAWGIRMPFSKKPYLFAFSIRRTRKEAIANFLYEPKSWKKYYRAGYRVVPVHVTEVK